MKNWKLVVFYIKHSYKSPGIFFFSKVALICVRNVALCYFFYLEGYIKADSEFKSLIKSSKNAIGGSIYTNNIADLQSI